MKSMLRKMMAVFCLMVAMVATVAAQNSFAYQAVIRNAKGDLVSNKQVSMLFNLKYNDQVVYSETHKTTTNQYGNVQVKVGEGTKVSGDFAKVPWHTMQVMMQIQVDPDGGTNYIDLGAIQLQSAPYAMHAATTGLFIDNSSPKSGSGALFEVKDKDGNVVFAVFPDGVRVYVDDEGGKPKSTGFAVAGRRAAKDGSEADLFSVTTEGTQVFVDDEGGKPMSTGFAVSGRRAAKDGESDFFTVGSTGTQIYLDNAEGKPMSTGFAVSGRRAAKDGESDKYMEINADGTHIYIDDDKGKPMSTGFAVSGRRAAKDGNNDKYMEINADGTQIFVDEGKPMSTGFAVSGRRAAKGKTPKLFEVNAYGTKIYIDEEGGKPMSTGFAVAGRRAAKDEGNTNKYMVIDANGTQIYVDYEDAKAMCTGFAVAGRRAAKDGTPNTLLNVDQMEGTHVYIDDSDGKPMSTGFAVAGRRAAKDGQPFIFQVTSMLSQMSVAKKLTFEDKGTSTSIMSMTPNAVGFKTENFIVGNSQTEESILTTSKDEGVQISAKSQVVLAGEVAQMIDTNLFTEVKLDPIEVISEIRVDSCKDLVGSVLGDVEGYELLKIFGEGLFTKNGRFDAEGNSIIMFDSYGIPTINYKVAAVTVILQDAGSEDAKLVIWPFKKIENVLPIHFGLKAAGDTNRTYVNVTALINSKEGGVNKVQIASADEEMGTVKWTGSAIYGGRITAIAVANPGYEFENWDYEQYYEWYNEETGEMEGEWGWDERYSNPCTIAVGKDSIRLTANFKPLVVEFLADPLDGGTIKVLQKLNNGQTSGNGNDGISEGGSYLGQMQYKTYGPSNKAKLEKVNSGDTLLFVAIPEAGYKFVNWNDDEELTKDTLTVKVEHSMEIVARFVQAGNTVKLPGTIEGEDFYDGGIGTYYNQEEGTSWQAPVQRQPYTYNIAYRNYDENRIGIDSIFTGEYALSFTTGGDWYEYDVNVEEEQQMRWAVRYANRDNSNVQIQITRDGKSVTDIISTPKTPGWWVYNMVSGVTENALPAGDYRLRLNFTQSACNVDKIMFGKADDVLLSINIEYADGDLAPQGWMPIGTVSGYGFYTKGSSVRITATPDKGYEFVGWSDGGKDAERTITITEDTFISASFVATPKIQIVANGPVKVSRGETELDYISKVEAEYDLYDYPSKASNDGNDDDDDDDAIYIYTYGCNIGDEITLDANGKKREFYGWYGNYTDVDFDEVFEKENRDRYFNEEYCVSCSTSRQEPIIGTSFTFTVEGGKNRFVAMYDEYGGGEDYYDAEIDNIKYKITDEEKHSCEVCGVNYDARGVLKIPEKVTIGRVEYSVDSIGEYAISSSSATMLTIPSSVKSIGRYAFNNCYSMRILFIPKTVTTIHENAFAYSYIMACCEADSKPDGWHDDWYNIVDGYSVWGVTADENGILYAAGTENTARVVGYIGGAVASLAIPESIQLGESDVTSTVTTIETGAFINSGIVSLTIPESVTSIGDNAFSGLININCNLGSEYDTWGAQYKNAIIYGDFMYSDENHTSIISYVGESKEVSIPDGVKVIGYEAFATSAGSEITSVSIPATVETIGESAFQNCSELSSVSFAESSQLNRIAPYAFYACPKIISIDIPSGVEEIGGGAFGREWGSSGVVNINYTGRAEDETGDNWGAYVRNGVFDGSFIYVDNSKAVLVKYLGDQTEVEIPNSVKTIGERAFYGSALQSIDLPNSVITIGDLAFAYCQDLKTVNLRDGLTTIGDNAFSDCGSLETVNIPATLTSLGNDVFRYGYGFSSNLKTNTYDNAIYLGESDNTVLLRASDYDIKGCTIHPDCKFINTTAFSGCSNIKSLEIPSSVIGIGTYAFSMVLNINYYGNADNPDEDNWGAQYRNAIIENDFLCNLLGEDESNEYVEAGTATVLKYIGNESEVTIPDTVSINDKKYAVKSITGNYIFGEVEVTKLTIPNSVSYISEYAISSENGLTVVAQGNWFRVDDDEAVDLSELDWSLWSSYGEEYYKGPGHAIYVGDNENDNRTGTIDNPYNSLAEAVATMNDSDADYIIYVDELSSAQEIPSSLTLDNAHSITLCGSKYGEGRIDANLWFGEGSETPATKATALTISTEVPVTIKNLTIAGGYADEGGGIYANNPEGSLTLAEGTVIVNNKAKNGGGIYTYNCPLYVTNGASIKYNEASEDGGGIYVYQYPEVTLSGSESNPAYISNNKANRGGGIFLSPMMAASVVMDDNVYINENTAVQGGGVYVSYGSTFEVNGGTITQNRASTDGDTSGDGGGVYLDVHSGYAGGTLTMTDGTILTNYTYYGDGAGVYVGAYGDEMSQFTMTGGTIAGNILLNNISGTYHGTGVYNAGIFEIGGTAKVVDDGDEGEYEPNDVFVPNTNASIIIVSDFEGFEQNEKAARLSLSDAEDFDGYQVISWEDESLKGNVVRFELNGDDYYLDTSDYSPGYVYKENGGE